MSDLVSEAFTYAALLDHGPEDQGGEELLRVYEKRNTPQFESLIAQLKRSFDELTRLTQDVETNGPEQTSAGE